MLLGMKKAYGRLGDIMQIKLLPDGTQDHVYLKLIILRWLLGQLAEVLNLADDVLVPGYIFFEFQGMP